MVEFDDTGGGRVNVGIDQAGQDHLAVEIDDRRARPARLQDLIVGPDAHNPVAFDGQSLTNREGGIDRDDPAVMENQIGVLCESGRARQAEQNERQGPAQQCAKDHRGTQILQSVHDRSLWQLWCVSCENRHDTRAREFVHESDRPHRSALAQGARHARSGLSTRCARLGDGHYLFVSSCYTSGPVTQRPTRGARRGAATSR